ncbi:MAG: alanine racemase [Anaerovoracaceae bacterium]|jgi:predicted amino acid racemase
MLIHEYPRLTIDLGHLKENVEYYVRRCAEHGISVAGVIKGMNGIPELSRMFDLGGCAQIASSRIEQIAACRGDTISGKPCMMIRIPMLSEVPDVIRWTDYSLNSDPDVLRALDAEAARQGKCHKVVIMADLGDLREGFWDKNELVKTCVWVERDLAHLELAGVGTNVGCYGSVLPTAEKLQELVELARKVEEAIGRKLEIVSGGATSSFLRVADGTIPEGINHLRCGEGILLARDLPLYYGLQLPDMHHDVFTFEAEIVEVKEKPSYPVGEIGVDAFGHRPHYEDRGMRLKAIAAAGRVDYGDPQDLFPRDPGVTVLGASSDHTILDITDSETQYRTGDIIRFDVNYGSNVFLTASRNVRHHFVNDPERS